MTTRNNAHARAGIDAALAEIGKTAGHTPGPWESSSGLSDTRGQFFAVVKELSPISCAVVCDIAQGSTEERRANANLIASAPELLACAMEYERTPPDVRATAAWHTPWYGRLAAAIAKAVQS